MDTQLFELLDKCRNNDRKAQSELYRLKFAYLMRIVRKYKKNEDDAAVLVNETFLKVFTNLDKYKKEIPFDAWIRKIAINTVIDEFRKAKKFKETFVFEERSDIGEHVINLAETEMNAEHILNFLNELDEQERTVFNLFEIDGYPHEEIAAMTGISERTSKRYLASARNNLKNRILNTYKTANVVL